MSTASGSRIRVGTLAGLALVVALVCGTVAAQSARVQAPAGSPAPAPAAAQPALSGAKAPARRSSLVRLVQPLWSSLGAAERQLLEPFAEQWNGWSAQEKRVWVSLASRFPKLSPADQAKARERIAEWAALTPAERKLARANYRLARQLPSEDRVTQWQRYETMTPEQRQVLRVGGWTSNTAAKHAGARTGLAKEAAKPLAEREAVWPEP